MIDSQWLAVLRLPVQSFPYWFVQEGMVVLPLLKQNRFDCLKRDTNSRPTTYLTLRQT